MINHKGIGRQIRELRVRRGWKQYELAEKVGMSRPAICNIEAGKRSLTLNTLKRFCEVFEIDISYFGIETDNFSDTVDIISRLDTLFKSDLPTEKKEELYRKIMKIYLDSLDN